MIEKVSAQAMGRLGVLAAVGLALVATSQIPCWSLPAEALTYEVASSCGPAGRVTLSHADKAEYGSARCSDVVLPALEVSGAEAVGLPAQGALNDQRGGGIDDGAFYLAGDVALVDAVPPVTVERVCHFDPAGGSSLTVSCVGHDPASACQGTLTPVEVQP